jgi:putative ABC transport system permease protein
MSNRTTRMPTLYGWLLIGEWRTHRLRALVAVGAIALGVALGFAIHLINASAFNEFSAAVKSLSGQSELQVSGTQLLFDEKLYPLLAQDGSVLLANPVLELDATLPERRSPLKMLGIDIFRAARMAPDLIGVPAPDKPGDTLADDAVFLSPAALEWLQLKPGQALRVQVGTDMLALRVAGSVLRARAGQRIAVMDIGAMQWRFKRIGMLSRIELRLADGINRDAFKTALAQKLESGYPGQFTVSHSADQETRSANLSRAYRVNLTVLALVALFTGAFLIFSTQALSVIRRRSQFALLRVLGLTRRQVLRQVLLEGASLGTIGAGLGIIGGYWMARVSLHFFGADLGGGYFAGVQPSVQFTPVAALVYFLLGTMIALLGSAAPAWEAAHAKPAPALKSGSEEAALATLATPWPALAALLLAGLLTQLPPLWDLPIFGYAAVALLLIGSIALMPRMAASVFGALSRAHAGAHEHSHAAARQSAQGKNVIFSLVLARLANAPSQAAIALGGILSSFSLMVAMAIMVASFRISVDQWLLQILPANLYVRSASSGNTGGLGPEQQAAIAAAPGVARADFLRSTQITLDPDRPNVILVARPIALADPGKTIPLIGEPLTSVPSGVIPIWISEPVVDLYGYKIGQRVSLPLHGQRRACIVAGIWRDYARQGGAIQINQYDYRTLSGDSDANDAALWLAADASADQVIAALKKLPFGDVLEFAQPGDIRALSLKIFDRSFAVTYLLEMMAIVIGLFGVAATFSAQTLARAKEFGMLRHIGVTKRQILMILAAEGGLLTAIGIAVGFVLGWLISLILVFIVNPQSFHFRMQLHFPWGLLASVAAILLAAATITALTAGRLALSGNTIKAVREDW